MGTMLQHPNFSNVKLIIDCVVMAHDMETAARLALQMTRHAPTLRFNSARSGYLYEYDSMVDVAMYAVENQSLDLEYEVIYTDEPL